MATEDDHHELTEHNGLKIPYDGQSRVVLEDDTVHDWGDDFDYNFETLDSRVLVPLTNSERTALTPTSPVWVYETDTGNIYYHNGTSWTLVVDATGGFDPTSNQTISGTWDFTTAPTINSNAVLTTADEGTGNGLDADTVDTYEAADLGALAENETVTGDWSFTGTGLTTFNTQTDFNEKIFLVAGNTTKNFQTTVDTSGANDYFSLCRINDDGPGPDITWECNRGNGQVFSSYDKGAGGWLFQIMDDGRTIKLGSAAVSGSEVTVLHTGDTGAGNGLDADLLDGEHASAFADATHATTHADGGADELDASDLAGAVGTAGDVLTTDGAAASWADPDTLTIDADTLDGYEGAAFGALAENETVTGDWDHTGDLEKDGENVLAAKQAPNLHMPRTKLGTTGETNDTATQSVYVPTGKTLYLWGWGTVEPDGTVPTDTSLKLMSGDLTGTPTNEYEEDPPSTWNEGAAGASLATVAGAKACHFQIQNDSVSIEYEPSVQASYTIE